MRRAALPARLALPASLLLLGASCAPRLPSGAEPAGALLLAEAPAEGASVILVVNDTMRADRVGLYGGSARTPVFDRFAREHVQFRRAWAPAPWTLPAVASLFTSLYPSAHGVVTPALDADVPAGSAPAAIERVHVLGESAMTLAEVLRADGYRTAAFVSNPWMDRRFGLDQGFDTYEDSFARWDLPGTVVSQAALDWLGRIGAGERFFLYVHYLDSHRPYGSLTRAEVSARALEIAADPRLLSAEASQEIAGLTRFEDGEPVTLAGYRPSLTLLEMAYDRGLEDFDRALGSLLRGSRAHPAYERTAIVVTSDHGEALYERGWGNHGHGLFEDEIHVPLAARLPGAAPASRIEAPVSLVDVMPTLCAYLGIECPSEMHGVSLVRPPGRPLDSPARYVVAEGVMWQPAHRAIRNARLKLLSRPGSGHSSETYALFDLERDPREARNLLAGEPSSRATEAATRMARALAAAVPAEPALPRRSAPLDPDQIERLRALGYLR